MPHDILLFCILISLPSFPTVESAKPKKVMNVTFFFYRGYGLGPRLMNTCCGNIACLQTKSSKPTITQHTNFITISILILILYHLPKAPFYVIHVRITNHPFVVSSQNIVTFCIVDCRHTKVFNELTYSQQRWDSW